jgi:hypothetical protein
MKKIFDFEVVSDLAAGHGVKMSSDLGNEFKFAWVSDSGISIHIGELVWMVRGNCVTVIKDDGKVYTVVSKWENC